MANIETEEFHLPDFWACALINGDTGDLEDEEIAAIDRFTDSLVKEYGHCTCLSCENDEGHFRTYHDAKPFGVLACNVIAYTFDITPR